MRVVTIGLITALATLSPLWPISAKADSTGASQDKVVQVLEHFLFSIERMPSSGHDGRMVLYKDSKHDSSGCSNCVAKFKFASDVVIRVGGVTSALSLDHLRLLPSQRLTAFVEGERVLAISFAEIRRGTRNRNDI